MQTSAVPLPEKAAQEPQKTPEKPPESEVDPARVLADLEKLDALMGHIGHVQKAAMKMGRALIKQGESEFGRLLIANCQAHDLSKFRGIEWDAIGDAGEDTEARTLAITNHQRTNNHHPEFWQRIQDMPDICIAEMVCDWYARSNEFGTDLKKWIREHATKRFGFTLHQKVWKEKIKKYLDLILDQPF